jgi:glycosyltransferase involved in cell wall biosynthesis
MLVYNNCTTDARVLKEASSLSGAGCDVIVIAVLDRTTSPRERRDGFEIRRIDRNPVHYRILRKQRQLMRYAGSGPRGWLALLHRGVARLAGVRGRRAKRRIVRIRSALGLGSRTALRVSRPGMEKSAPQETRRQPSSTIGEPHEAAMEAPHEDPLPVSDTAGRTAASARTRLWRTLMSAHKPLMFLDYYGRAYRLLRGERLDAVHAHDLNTLPVAAAVANAHRIRLVYDSHELYTEVSTLSERERRVWRLLERLLIRRADHTVTVCKSIADELVARYEIEPPLVVLNTPRHPERPIDDWDGSRLREHLGLEDSSEALVLYQGGFAPHRGLESLVASAAGFEHATLVLLGWGSLEDELRRLIRMLGLEQRVRMMSPVPPELLLTYTVGADLGVIPYRPVGLNNYYTTPNKLFEYMAAGVPVVASRLPELVRFVEGLRIGETFDPDRPEEIASSVNSLLNDPRERAGMRQRAIEASRRLSWDLQVQGLLKIYRVAPHTPIHANPS